MSRATFDFEIVNNNVIIHVAAKRPGLTQLSISCSIISDGPNFGWLK